MLIEEIIEFELMKPGLRDHKCTVTPKTGYFHGKGKTKISTATLRVIYKLYTKNIAVGNVPCFPRPEPSYF